jgi:hypothetical protein
MSSNNEIIATNPWKLSENRIRQFPEEVTTIQPCLVAKNLYKARQQSMSVAYCKRFGVIQKRFVPSMITEKALLPDGKVRFPHMVEINGEVPTKRTNIEFIWDNFHYMISFNGKLTTAKPNESNKNKNVETNAWLETEDGRRMYVVGIVGKKKKLVLGHVTASGYKPQDFEEKYVLITYDMYEKNVRERNASRRDDVRKLQCENSMIVHPGAHGLYINDNKFRNWIEKTLDEMVELMKGDGFPENHLEFHYYPTDNNPEQF